LLLNNILQLKMEKNEKNDKNDKNKLNNIYTKSRNSLSTKRTSLSTFSTTLYNNNLKTINVKHTIYIYINNTYLDTRGRIRRLHF